MDNFYSAILNKMITMQLYMNIDRLLTFLKEITSIYSPSESEQLCADFLMQTFKAYNPLIDQNGNVFFKVPGIGDPILLCAHMDVVEPCDKRELVVENEMVKNKYPFVLGLDNKAAIACIFEVVQVLQEAGGASRRPLEVLFTAQEETTNNGAKLFDYANNVTAKEGLIIDSALPFGSVITKSPYYTTFDIVITGPTHHTKELTTGEETAWKKLSELITILPYGSISPDTNINWSTISGGTGRNTVTEKFAIQGEMRSFNKTEFDSITDNIKNLVAGIPNCFIDTTNQAYNPGYAINENDTWLQHVKNTISKVTNTPSQSITTYGLSDANEIRQFGINILNISSGAQYTHTKDETIAVSDLENAVKVLLSLITTSYEL